MNIIVNKFMVYNIKKNKKKKSKLFKGFLLI